MLLLIQGGEGRAAAEGGPVEMGAEGGEAGAVLLSIEKKKPREKEKKSRH